MNWIEKRLIEHSNPAKYALEVIGWILGIYGLWIHNIPFILTGIIILPLMGSIYVWLGEKRFKLLLLNHLHIVNIATHISGFFIGVYGLWQHNYSLIIISLALMIIGHIYTWR